LLFSTPSRSYLYRNSTTHKTNRVNVSTGANMSKTKLAVILPLILGILLVITFLSFTNSEVVAQTSIQPESPTEDVDPSSITAPVTTITVTSGTDPDDSKSKTCYTDPPGPPGPPTPPCTLRRAIVEANALSAVDRPILIRFDIPALPAEGYDPALDIWVIELYTLDTLVLGRLKDGGIIIDGSTQPGGRNDGPKIILLGPGTGQKDGMVVGDVAGDDGNELRGLGFQNFKTHLYVNTDFNIIEDNWFGLSDDGTDVYLRNDDTEDGSGNAGIAVSAGAENNLIQNNVFLGFDGVAVAIREASNTFTNNYVGTTADGTIPTKETDPDLICSPVDWLGGGGITVDGDDHIIANNFFAGLRQDIFQISTQPSAIQVTGDGHQIQNNVIGLDALFTEVGVCGRGIYMISSPENTQVLSNTIVNSGLSAISLNGVLYNANTLRSNVIKNENDWPEVEGNPKPEDAIQLGASLPEAFTLFKPAKVNSIQGTTVNGSNGQNSLCPNCLVELFLEDSDLITETLQSLALVQADNEGNWTAEIPFALSSGLGVRTTSTTAKYNTIPNMFAGTTTGLSELYVSGYEIFMPFITK
jgi:hypothetical protein